jgi:hypothetical protein
MPMSTRTPLAFDWSGEFRRVSQRSLLLVAVLAIAVMLAAIPVRSWGDEAWSLAMLWVLLFPAPAMVLAWWLLKRRAFRAMRAVAMLNTDAVAHWRDVLGDPLPTSAETLAARLGGRADPEAHLAKASWFLFEGRADEARAALAGWTASDPVLRARRARIEAVLALEDGDDDPLASAEATIAEVPDGERSSVELARLHFAVASSQLRRGVDPMASLLLAADALGPTARRSTPDVERGIARMRTAMAVVAVAPAITFAVLFLLVRGPA